MLIAKLRISLKDANIKYNSSAELETTKERGTVLADGKIVRGLGTHFESQEAKERFDRLTSRSNAIREEFNRKFVRGPFEGTFIVPVAGQGKSFAVQFNGERPDIEVDCFEYDILGNPDEKEMAEWGERIAAQLKRIPLGRAEGVDGDGLEALEGLASCPGIAQETKDRILQMVGEVRVGKMNRVDFKRGISMIKVTMDGSSLTVNRRLSDATPA